MLAESSNTGTVLIGQTMTDDQRYSMMRAFGFGQETGIELPGESAAYCAVPTSGRAVTVT